MALGVLGVCGLGSDQRPLIRIVEGVWLAVLNDCCTVGLRA